MIRQSQGFLSQIYAVLDFFFILIIYILTYWLRFRSGWFVHEHALSFSTYMLWGISYSVISIIIGFIFNYYTPRRRKRFSFDFLKILQIQIIALLGLISVLFVLKEVHVSRIFLALLASNEVVLLTVYRYIIKKSLKKMRGKGFNRQFILIIGAGSLGSTFYKNLQLHPELGFEVVGFLDDQKSDRELSDEMPSILGYVSDLQNILQDKLIDEVVIALPLSAHEKYGEIIAICEKTGVKTLIIPDFFHVLPARPHFDNFAGMPLINVRDIPLDELQNRFFKRLFDIVFSIVFIIITSPLLLILAAGVKCSSRGPVIFKQERVGLNRRVFHIYKFRTMVNRTLNDADERWTVKNDKRVTGVGRILRRTSLDELPQFINVLKGDMSIVGPRPERPHFVNQFKEEVPRYMIKHHVRPGITGFAQSNGYRGDTSIRDRIDYDVYYLENWTFLFDIKIILKTVLYGFRDRNAY